MKINKYIVLTLVITAHTYAMEEQLPSGYVIYEGKRTPITKLKPKMIEDKVDSMLNADIITPSMAEKINELINALSAQSPSRGQVLRDRFNARMTERKLRRELKPETKRVEYKEAPGLKKVEYKEMPESSAGYGVFKDKIKHMTKIMNDINTYLHNQKLLTDVAGNLEEPITPARQQKISDIQSTLKGTRQNIKKIMLPLTDKDFRHYLSLPESASEKAYFKDALEKLYKTLRDAVNAVASLVVNNPKGTRQNAVLIQDFVVGDEGLIEHMTHLISIGDKFGVISEKEKQRDETDLLNYIARLSPQLIKSKIE